MSKRRLVAVLIAAAIVAASSGCTTWNDRFHVPGRDPLLTLMGAEYEDQQRLWPPAELPYLRPMRTELIPDRQPPSVEPAWGWPPL